MGNVETGTVKEKLTRLVSEYGGVGIAVFASIWLLTFGGAIVAIKSGLEDEVRAALQSLMSWLAGLGLPIDMASDDFVAGAGVLVIAWLVLRVTLPLRILLTVALTPLVARAVKAARAR